MTKFLQNIFSVKNEKNHKVIKLIGIKFKFLNNKKFLKNTIEENALDIKKYTNTKIFDLEKKLNQKYKKEFLIDNVNNSDYFNFELEIYNFFEEAKAGKFYKIFQNRLSYNFIKKELDKLIKRFGKTSYILSDLEDVFPNEYNRINNEDIDAHKDEDCIFILAYNKDFLAIESAKLLEQKGLKYYALPIPFPLARYFHTDKASFDTLKEESNTSNDWHFCPVDFENIFQVLDTCKNLEGDYVEIGTFKGDSASAALNFMQRKGIDKKAYFLDTFIGFDYDEAYASQDGLWQNTHKTTSLEEVKKRLEKYKNANVIQANIISNELPVEIEKICVANIDVDMYEAVKSALYKVKDKIVKNGIIIAEDYGHTPGLIGAQKAVQEFLEENPDLFITIYLQSGQMLLIKK